MQVLRVLLGMLTAAGIASLAGCSFASRLVNRRHRKLIEGSLNLQAIPCDDFYEFACGNWHNYMEGAGRTFYETLTMVDYYANVRLVRYLQSFPFYKSPAFARKASDYYKSCENVEQYEPLEYLQWMKTHEQLRWPNLWKNPTKSDVQFDWVRTLAVMRRYGMNGILIEEIMLQKKDDPDKLVVDLDKPVEGGGFVSLTYDNMKVLFDSLGIAIAKSAFEKLWQEFSDFEELLVKLDDIEDEEGSKLITAKELPLDWQSKYLSIVLNRTELDPNMELYIQNVPYMESLDALLKQYDNRFICKYLEIRFLWHLNMKGPANFMPVDCISSARSLMSPAMYWIYEQKHPELATQTKEIQQLFTHIMQHFNKTLHLNKNEFNQTVLDYLLTKLNNIQLKVGNLPRINTSEVLEQYFASLHLNKTDFYGNHLKLLHFNFNKSHENIPNAISKNASTYFHLENYETGSSSSPYFIQRSNMVLIPPTVLQPPIYHSDYEDIYKFSSLGFLLAHEVLHSIDFTGLEVDVTGKLNTDQYNNILENPAFDKNYNCLRELNPAVVDEKIADASGIRYAFETYFELHPEDANKTQSILGLRFSMKELFFLNFAQFFCGSSTSDDVINTSEHGLDSDRVNDALSHFPEFAKTFSCFTQSRMRPTETCHLWR